MQGRLVMISLFQGIEPVTVSMEALSSDFLRKPGDAHRSWSAPFASVDGGSRTKKRRKVPGDRTFKKSALQD